MNQEIGCLKYGLNAVVFRNSRERTAEERMKRYYAASVAYAPGMPCKLVSTHRRQQRLQGELDKAVKAMNFERAAVLRDILHPEGLSNG